MFNMIISKRSHCEVTVIISRLPSQCDIALAFSRFDEILGQELALLVEIVFSALEKDQSSPDKMTK